MTVFWTVITGVLVFTLSQYVLKIVIEPSMEIKRRIADLASQLLMHQAKVVNNRDPDKEIAPALKQCSARIRTASFLLPQYDWTRRVFQLPSDAQLLTASRETNHIANNLLQSGVLDGQNRRCGENVEALEAIQKNLRVKTQYFDMPEDS